MGVLSPDYCVGGYFVPHQAKNLWCMEWQCAGRAVKGIAFCAIPRDIRPQTS
jgi:hypothetical protein